jgi:ribosomal protein S18 acetylase RimI-like enzyme
MLIRPFQAEDEAAVIALWRSCGLVVARNNPAADIRRKLRVDPELFLVGILESQPIATVIAGYEPGTANLPIGILESPLVATVMAGYEGHRGWTNYLAVAPAFQRNGYGREMMEHAEQLLRDRGCPKINLLVRSANREVIEFYRRLGFSVDEVSSMGKRLVIDEPFSGAE